MPGVWDIISSLFKPLSDVVDDLHTSGEEKLEAQAKLLELQSALAIKVMDYESKIIEAQQAVLVAEATTESWITRSWRPIVMLTFTALIVYSYFGGPAIDDNMWSLLNLGVGGYVVGRSVEKIAPVVADTISSIKNTAKDSS